MQLIVLGSGSAFSVDNSNYHSNFLLQNGEGNSLLIDVGSDARFSLYEQNLKYFNIQNVFITHLHADHIGGLEWLGLSSHYDPQCSKPKLIIPKYFTQRLWEHCLSGTFGLGHKLEDFFKVEEAKNFFHWHEIKFELVQTKHIEEKAAYMPSFGLFFSVNGTNIYFTSDTIYNPQALMPYYKKADIIFHDCDKFDYHSGVHVEIQEIALLDETIRNKIWLYQCDAADPNLIKNLGLRGILQKGQVFNF
jgi:ribonuclease BN (tRNA processing enzyme)